MSVFFLKTSTYNSSSLCCRLKSLCMMNDVPKKMTRHEALTMVNRTAIYIYELTLNSQRTKEPAYPGIVVPNNLICEWTKDDRTHRRKECED